MFSFVRSKNDPHFLELKEGDVLIQEIDIRFPLKFLKSFFETKEEALLWLKEIEKKLCKRRAYFLISKRSYSSILLLKKLEEKGFCFHVCQEMVQELVRLGYIQDEDYFTNWIYSEFKKGNGPKMIAWKGKAKGISEAMVRKLITHEMQKEKIQKIYEKMKKDKKKALQALYRKGFDLDLLNFFL